jgi:amidase
MASQASLPDATELARRIAQKELSALEAVDDAIGHIEQVNPQLNFLVTECFDRARDRARSGGLTGAFAGVPYLVKDMFDVAGLPTRWGTRATAALPPASADSTQVLALQAAGLVVLGKSALGEMGFLPTTEPLAFGPTRNPWDRSRTPGGSSGGSAAAVAAGVVPMADAADGGGSIRIPASACGLFGLKPSRGRLVGEQVPAAGLDVTVEHCVSRSVRDSARLFSAMEDPGSGIAPVGMVTGASGRRLRVGMSLTSLAGRQPTPDVVRAVETTAALLEQLGHRVEPTDPPLDGAAFFADFAALWAASAGEVVDLARELGGADPDETVLEPFTLAMAELSRTLGPGDLNPIRARLIDAGRRYDSWFDTFDVVLSPVLVQPPVPIGHIAGDVSIEDMSERLEAFASYTPIHNVAGAPAMSVPLTWNESGLPIGSHFAARVGEERTLFELAYELEAAQPWAGRFPVT